MDGTLLKCLENNEFKHIVVNIHENIFGSCLNHLKITHKLLKVGYYWPTIEKECTKLLNLTCNDNFTIM